MRVAVLSDIHGFDLALARVLLELQYRGPFDEVVVAGDLFVLGPGPDKVLELLRQTGFSCVLGNGDRELLDAALGNNNASEVAYALTKIGPQGVDFLATLPFEYRVSPPEAKDADDDLLVVHANPHDLETKLRPEMNDDEIVEVLGNVLAAAIAFGHHHVAFVREVDGILLVDVSAVGNPKDGDLRCKFGILTWDPPSRQWSAEIVRLDYPLDETIAEMRRSRMPQPERAIQRLLRASYS